MLLHIPGLMDKGKPVSVLFTDELGERSPLLYCELIQKARFGDSFLIKNQGCKVGEYVLGNTEIAPVDYYYGSGRYMDLNAAKNAVSNLRRLNIKGRSMSISPYEGGKFDILILFLKPERAMRIVQACAYCKGEPVELNTGGIASICSDCTALQGKPAISLGCKGSRKHSRYGDDEVVVGLPFMMACEIDKALCEIPETVA